MRHTGWKDAALLFAGIALALLTAHRHLGYAQAHALGYGAVVVLAAVISASFAWLWRARATPLALGMAVSWAGAGGVMAWWWAARLLGHPAMMTEARALFLLLALYLTGAALHLRVIAGATERPWLVIAAATALALGVPVLAIALT